MTRKEYETEQRFNRLCSRVRRCVFGLFVAGLAAFAIAVGVIATTVVHLFG